MKKTLSPEEVAILINARRILKDKGLAADTDVSGVCKAAGISRKTGYQWARKHIGADKDRQKELEAELVKLKVNNMHLKKANDDLDFINQARELAWEIHRVDELLAEKKSNINSPEKKKP